MLLPDMEQMATAETMHEDVRKDSIELHSEALCSLIGAVGRPGFASELLRCSRGFAAVDFVSIVLFPNPSSPICFGTDSAAGKQFAEIAADQYIKRYHQDDPNIRLMFSCPASSTHVTYLGRDDVPTMEYRLSCYDRAHIIDRVSVLSRTEEGVPFSVSFYGGSISGPLGPEGQQALKAFFPIARSLALRHIEIARRPVSSLTDAVALVRARFPMLSPREGEVIAGAISNMTAVETARALGIGATSVITHRRNAYARIGVGSLRELFHRYSY